MGTGYVRIDTSNNIADGGVIDASDLDGEFNALVESFSQTVGHTHDGSTAEGAPVTVLGPAQEFVGDASGLYPKTTNTYTLGKAGATFSNIFVEVVTLADGAITSTAAEINKLDGVTVTTTELNLLDGQDQTLATTDSATFVNVTATGNVVVTGTVDGRDVSADGTKLDTLETGSTADQTASQIKAAYEGEANAFTDAQFTKLSNIETGATADQTAAQIKTAYEGEANAFTDTQFTKLGNVEDGATADQTGAQIKTAYESESNAFTDTLFTKLGTVETNADVTDTANVTAAGALMDSEVTNLAAVKAFDTTDYATATQGGTADSALQPDGDGSALTGIVAGLAWARKTSNYTSANNDAILADTSGGAWTLTLPSSPSVGDLVRVLDGADWATNNLTVARNGSTVEGDAADLVMNIGGVSVDFVYDGSTWQIYAQVGVSSGSVVTEAGTQTLTNKTLDAPSFSNAVFTGDGSALTGIVATASGAISAFAFTSVPTGWLECDGSTVSRTTYSDLFTAIGDTFGAGDGSTTFAIPDLRGEFLRGWDNGRGIDASRALGSFQDQETRFYRATSTNTAALNIYSGGPYNGDFAGKDADSSRYYMDRTIYVWDTAQDTRPRSIAMMYCIKF